MLRIDAHQHFWQYNPVRDAWIDDTMEMIRKDFLPEDLKPLLEAHGIDGCVAVQADQSETETEFLLNHTAGHSFVKGVVGWIDLCSPAVEERLEHYSRFGILKGFRHILQAEHSQFMLEERFMKGISLLHRYGFTYDILIYAHQLNQAIQLVKAFPEQPFVIDHIAKPDIRKGMAEDWSKGIKAMAAFSNVYCKVSGMVTEADWKEWNHTTFQPYLDVVVEAFGMNRLMYGSDWPVCLLAADYGSNIGIVKEYFSTYSDSEKAGFFGGNAVKFYQLI
jgi:L-fuconolactonase